MKKKFLIYLGIIFISCNSAKQEQPTPETCKLLTQQLDSIYFYDQNNRIEIEPLEQKIEIYSKALSQTLKVVTKQDSDNLKNAETEMAFLLNKTEKQDAINLQKVKKIIDTYGWLGTNAIGKQANTTLFLVIQHADLATQQKYLPIIKDAVKNKKANPAELALLIDRIEMRNGRPQIYGSQIIGKDGKHMLYPIIDEANVNARRDSVGLEPLENYLKQWNIKYKPLIK